jgi:hypothetical protein
MKASNFWNICKFCVEVISSIAFLKEVIAFIVDYAARAVPLWDYIFSHIAGFTWIVGAATMFVCFT